jgi:hypothetical protein
MKYTTLLIVALLATATLAASGCDKGKCATCVAAGNDETCTACYKSKPAFPAGVTTYQNCSGTSASGCILTVGAVCAACDVSTHLLSLLNTAPNTCVPYDTAGTPTYLVKTVDVNCTAVKASALNSDTKGLCQSCKGSFKPSPEATPATCTAITATVVTGCAAHTADN